MVAVNVNYEYDHHEKGQRQRESCLVACTMPGCTFIILCTALGLKDSNQHLLSFISGLVLHDQSYTVRMILVVINIESDQRFITSYII